jgi:hypothetical protein
VVERMNALGISVDLSHCGLVTSRDGIGATRRPPAFTHTMCKAVYDHVRAKPDDLLRALADKGGVVGIATLGYFIGPTAETSFDDYLRHVDHAVKAAASWSTSDPAIASISDLLGLEVTGETPGEATITASWQGLSAELHVTVVAGTQLPLGAPRWVLAPPNGFSAALPIQAHPIDETTANLFSIETDGSTYRVRGLTFNGEQLWLQHAPGPPAFGDTFGGLVSRVSDSRLARFGGPPTVLPWRFESTGSLVSDLAQGPDGTIYVVEQASNAPDRFLIGVDGSTGERTFRRALPTSSAFLLNIDCIQDSNTGGQIATLVTSPVIGEDDAAYLLVSVANTVFNYLPCGTGAWSASKTLALWRIASDGSASSTDLWTYTYGGPGGQPIESAGGISVMPDGQGGVLASWSRDNGTAPPGVELKVTRVSGAVQLSVH